MSEEENEDEQIEALEIEFDTDSQGRVFMLFTCQHCGRNRAPVAGKRTGDEITCSCGETTLELSGDDLGAIQETLDDVERQIRDAFKGFKF